MTLELVDDPRSSEALSDSEWMAEAGRRRLRRAALRTVGISTGGGPLAAPFGEGLLVFSEAPPLWFRATLEQISLLGELEENWDSYGARAVDPQCALAAVTLLLSILGPNTPAPAIVPTTRGGLQLEWHRGGVDLEIDIQSPSRFHVVYEDESRGEEWERTITSDLQPLAHLMERLEPRD